MERVQSSNAVYDFKRALWFNSEWITRLSDEDFVEKVKDYLFIYGNESWKEIIEHTEHAYRMKLASEIKIRIQTLGQFREHCSYFFVRPAHIDMDMVHREKMNVTPEIVQ
jgi:glutamyl/glutaminyl-tRNA synthetase